MKLVDIARKANVSIATVSRVINNSANVDEGKVQRVRRVLAQNEYLPDTIARSLASRRTATVGIMTPDIRHLNCAPIAYSVERVLNDHAYHTVLCNTGTDVQEQIRYLKTLVSRRIDGMILIGAAYSRPEIAEAIERYLPATPVVMLNSGLRLANVVSVFGSSDTATRTLTRHLLEHGHTRIVFLRESDSWVQMLKERVFVKTMAKHGITVPDRHLFQAGHDKDVEALADRIEAEAGAYTAVMAYNDLAACGIISHLRRRGKDVPRKVSVVGYHNLEYSRYMAPALTTIDNRMEHMGEVMARALLDRLAGKEVPATIRTPVKLVVRDSVGRVGKKA